MEKIGAGGEKNIYVDRQNPSRIEAVYRMKRTDEEMKAMYYFNKLLALLFPNQIAVIHKAGNEKEEHGGESKYIAQRVELSEELKPLAEMNIKLYDPRDGLTKEESSGVEKLEDLFYDKQNNIKILQSLRQIGSRSFNVSDLFPDMGNVGNVSSLEEDAMYLDLTTPFEVSVASAKRGRVTWKIKMDKLYDLAGELEGEDRRLAETYLERMEALYGQAIEKAG